MRLLPGRFLRSMLALGLLAMLIASMVIHRNRLEAVKSELGFSAAAMSWNVSELLLETINTSKAMMEYRLGVLSEDSAILRFEILWSRMIIARDTEIGKHPDLRMQLELYRAFLERWDELLLAPGDLPGPQVDAIVAGLDRLSTQLRSIWIAGFNSNNFKELTEMASPTLERQRRLEGMIGLACGIMVLYLLAELLFAVRSREYEAELRRKAIASSEAKTRFLANVSHEIRTPLNGILGMAGELAETPLSAEQAGMLRVLDDSGRLLLATLNDVLDLSKIEAGQLQIEAVSVDLHALLRAVHELYLPLAHEKGLAMRLHIAPGLPAHITSDPLRLRQALNNLVANAIKFTAQGHVEIRAKARHGGRTLSVEVEDSGIGISASVQEQIFQPFAQANSSTTRTFGGTGLGLSITRRIARQMGGNLTCHSVPGQGSVFCCDVLLVAAREHVVPSEAALGPPDADLAAMRVMVVDDNQTNRVIAQKMLTRVGVHVTLCASGREAVEAMRDGKFHIIFMDVQMPGMDGLEATRAIRLIEEVEGRSAATIVALTANVMDHQVATYIAAGMDGHLPKPVSRKGLLTQLERRAARRMSDAA